MNNQRVMTAEEKARLVYLAMVRAATLAERPAGEERK